MSKADILHHCLQSESGTAEQRAEWITALYELHEREQKERSQLEAENMKLREVINLVYSCLEFDRSFTGFVARAKRLIEETKNEQP